MGNLSTVILPDILRSIDSASFTGNYQLVGTALSNSIRLIKFTNNSSANATISWDGINDHDFLPSFSFLLLDISSNREITHIFEIQAGTQFYVKGASGVGLFYISTYYARNT